jgi:iron-hydrogenase subunit gamma
MPSHKKRMNKAKKKRFSIVHHIKKSKQRIHHILKKKILTQKKAMVKKTQPDVRTQNVVERLQELQEQKTYISKEDMIALSKREKIPGVDIYGVATFYAQFKLKKPGKYVISVCTGTACHVKNSDSILNYLEEILGVKKGETTADGLITLEAVNCIGACAKAPAMMINGTVYGLLTKEKARKIIEELK